MSSNIGPPLRQHRLKALLPAGTVVAHKTGTSGMESGIINATKDIGLLTMPDSRRLAVAVLLAILWLPSQS